MPTHCWDRDAQVLEHVGYPTTPRRRSPAYVFYNQGSLRQVLVGGVGPTILDENTVGGNSDDVFISLLLRPNGHLDTTFGSPGSFVWADADGEICTYPGTIVANASSLTITLVAEPTSSALAALPGVLAARVRRRRNGV